jgi:alpha-tubulin suppressor-like RCC1 family protein
LNRRAQAFQSVHDVGIKCFFTHHASYSTQSILYIYFPGIALKHFERTLMFVRTKSHSLSRHLIYHWGRAALRYALVLALLALTLFTGPQPARAVATASSTPGTVVAWGSNLEDASTVPSDLTDVIAIAAGGSQNLALKSDGTVVAWGSNSEGQGNIPTGLATVTAIAAGYAHNLALKADGTVVAWGNNNYGQATAPAGLIGVTAIAAGANHSLALKADGTVVAWGDNGASQEGQATVPAGLSNVTAIAAGEVHSLARKANGTVVAWGGNFSRQATVPAELTNVNVTAIAAGNFHNLALKADGTVVAWGYNSAGQATVPGDLTGVTAIAAGFAHSLALKADGTVVAWGDNEDGQRNVPGNLANVTAIAAGGFHSVALVGSAAAPEIDVLGNGVSIVSGDSTPVTADHTDFGSADVDGGTVVRTFTIENSGDAALTLSSSPLVAISGDQAAEFTVTALPSSPVAGGGNTTFQLTFDPGAAGIRSATVTITNDDGDENSYTFAVQGTGTTPPIPGTVVAWGSDLDGASIVPSDLTGVIAIAAGGYQNLALKADGTVVAWGRNDNGQGTIPTGLATVTAIAAGNGHNLALKADGTVVAWGRNNSGQAAVPGDLTNVIAIAAGANAFHSLALKADGTVVAWGDNSSGQATVPAGLSDVTALAAGYHSLALKADGTVVAWGNNSFGQATVPGNLANVTAIAASFAHSLALKADGTVVAWGGNFDGQATVPAGLTNVIAIAAGQSHSLALKRDGTVVAWGSNNNGQISVPGNLANVTAITAGTYHSVALVPSVAAPEIDVLGNSISIVSGDSTPVTTDHTDFGSADVDGGTVVRTFTIENSGDAALTLSGSPLVAISGDQAAEFTVTALPSSPVAASGSTTFQITFDPGAAGIRTATVTIANDDGDENPYTFAVQGTGFLPNVQFNGTACDLIDAINAANSDSASGTCPAGSGADTITLLSDITLSAINNTNNFGSNGLPQITSDITIEGDGHTLSRAAGASLFRFFDVDASGTLTLNRLTLHNGDALDANYSIAGAIFNWGGTVTVNNSTLSNNNGSSGGAIFNLNGTIMVNNSTFSGNTANGDGGAITNSATMTVNNSTFSGNSSSKGGAINNSDTATVNSSTFSGNAATNQGGAIYNGEGNTLTLARSLLSGNSAADGAELYNEPEGFMPAGIVNSNNGNLFGQNDNAGTSGFTPTASDLVPSVGLSAILASLADNSGGTQTHALVAGSPAIDAAGDSGLATDQRGIARPQGCADDIGAFELDGVTCPSPEIDVQGNGVSIANGDSTPATADHTAFGSAEINSGTVVRTFTIHNSGDAALSAIAVRVERYEPAAAHSGAVLPFSLTSVPATTVAAGQSTQFQITFAPSESGESSAVVIIESNDANEGYYVFIISGEGVTPPQATITIVLDARPEIQTNLGFQSSFGPFILDDSAVDDGDTYTNTKSFTVAPGSYSVTRNNPTTWFTTAITCTPDGNATINLPQRRATITVVSGDNVTCTFTVERAVRITARAFNDLVRTNANLGKRNAGDPWLNSQPMTLTTSPTQTLGSGVTAPVGTLSQISFANLRSGSYTLCTGFPTGWTLTTPTAVDPAYGQPCKTVTLSPGQAAIVLFGAYQPAVAASVSVTPEEELITDDDSIVEMPYDPVEDETATAEDGLLRLFLPLIKR